MLFVKCDSKAWLGLTLCLCLWLSGCGTVDLKPPKAPVILKRTPSVQPELPPAVEPSDSRVVAPAVLLATDWTSYRKQAARKIMAINPSATYAGVVPDPLASIPVLEVTLNGDGSVRAIAVLRRPKFFPETIDLAKAAILRAAPFGSVAHLPRPWSFNETFLFNDALKFQVHSLQP